MSSSLPEEFHPSNLTLNYPDKSCFTRSQWKLPSWAYPVWRMFWCVWHVTWLVIGGVRTRDTAPEDDDGVKWFTLASNWTFLLTTIFCVVDCLVVFLVACQKSRDGNNIENPEGQATSEKDEILFHGEFTLVEGIKTPTTPCRIKVQWALFEAVNCTNLLTTIIFWTCQYQDGDHIHPDTVIFTIINSIFVVINIIVTGIPVRILHFIYPAIFISVYFLFNLIYYLADGTSLTGSDVIFRPLEWDEAYPTTVTIIVGLLLATPLAHLVFFSIYTLRIYLADKYNLGHTDAEPVISGHYRKRDSQVKIEEGKDGGTSVERSGRDNAAFDLEWESGR